MPNQIDRDAFVKRDVLKNPIPYTRGTDLLPIVIHFRDFQIPSGATARVFVAKSDGNAVYTTATIDGNDVTVDVTDQMFIELGMALIQISIMDGEEELVSFVQPVDVKQNLKAGDFPESITDVSFLDDAIEQANEAVNTATAAAQQAATAVQNANTAVSNANDAIEELNEQIASLNNNFATLAQTVSISQLQTTAKNLVGAVNELNSNRIARSLVRVQCTANATTVINSDNATVTVGKLPESRQTYIPVVVGHSMTNSCIDNVCYDSSAGWFIYTTYAQSVSIMFYDTSKITHVEASS